MSDGNENTGYDSGPEAPDREAEGVRLSAVEARVLGCLVEKESTTPDAYPLTLNATTTACNQKTSRDPVMKLDPGRVGQALRELERKGLVRHDFSSRAERYRHTAEKGLELTRAQLALVALLMLRGPQTVNELLTRCERIHRFEDAEDVAYTLERLGQKSPPLVVRLPRQSGQREDRYMHLLCGPVDMDAPSAAPRVAAPENSPDVDELIERIEALERRVKDLEEGTSSGD
ncbi:YceH family protein [Wenzhouxiangella sp. EGI_FJ10305]|uniref:YceH family protein n=1 Tax=Wenzhouxiangella sp. EGI_FJ10305 TaxID=3243768 RepID=UPI0035DA4BB7